MLPTGKGLSKHLGQEELGIRGKMVNPNTFGINNLTLTVKGKFIKTAMVREEWDEDVADPQSVVNAIKRSGIRIDLFTFVQRLPESRPKFDYHMVWDSVAAVPIKNYEHWLENQITKQARNRIKKARKTGVEIRHIPFDDELIKSISDIYNEMPIKQGRRYRHYGMSLERVRTANSTFLERCDFIGAYYDHELIGYIKIVYSDRYARTMGILAKVRHRDKSPMNLLLAKAIEICAEKKVSFLTYARYDYGKVGSESMKEFKKNNGFENILVPRYYIPLNKYGKIAVKLGLYKGLKNLLPRWIVRNVLRVRRIWYSKKEYVKGGASGSN